MAAVDVAKSGECAFALRKRGSGLMLSMNATYSVRWVYQSREQAETVMLTKVQRCSATKSLGSGEAGQSASKWCCRGSAAQQDCLVGERTGKFLNSVRANWHSC